MNARWNVNATRILAPVFLAGCLFLLPACDAMDAVKEARSPVGQWVYREGIDSFTLTITEAYLVRGTATLSSFACFSLTTTQWSATGTFNDPAITLSFSLVSATHNGEAVTNPNTTLAMSFSGRMEGPDMMTGRLTGTGVGTEHVTFERTR